MKRTVTVLGCVGVLVASQWVAAQAPQAPKPTAEHQRLGYFAGNWTGTGEMKPGPMGPGGNVVSKESCEWFEGRFALVCRSEMTTGGVPMKGVAIMSYSPDEKVYTYYGTDSMGMTMMAAARGTLKGDTWAYTDESMMGGQKMATRVTIKEASPTSYTFSMEMAGPDGKFAPVMTTTNTKVK